MASDVKAGSLALLTTTIKTDIVAAINEVKAVADAAIPSTTEIQNVRSGKVTLNGVNPTSVTFKGDGAANVTSSNIETFDLSGVGDGGTIIMNPDGAGNKTATINFAAATSISGASPSLDISASVDNKFMIQVRGDTAEEVVLTIAGGLNSGANIAAELQTRIRALGGNKAAVTVDYNVTEALKYAITDSVLGTSSSVVITRASGNNITEELKIGLLDGGAEVAGTGDVADSTAATALEIATVITADMAGITAVDVAGAIKISSDTTGTSSSIVEGNGTLNAVLGFTNAAVHTGANGLGYATDMANATYQVIATLNGTAAASLGATGLSINNRSTTGFDIECETVAATEDVDVIIVGDAA